MSVKEIKPAPNKDLIECLEGLLRRAKLGEIQTMVTVLLGEGDTWNGWINLTNKNTRIIIAELVILQQLLTDKYVQDEKANFNQ